MKKALAVIACGAAVVVSACGGPVIGTVISHNHRQAWDEIYMQPIFVNTCIGRPVYCFSNVAGYYPTTWHHNERWDLIVRTDEGKIRTAHATSGDFLKFADGDHYEEPE